MKTPKAKKLPSGNWFIQLRFTGEPAVYITRTTEKECVRAAELAKAEHRAGKRLQQTVGKTVRQAAADFINVRQHVLSPSTIKAYRSITEHRFQSIMDAPISRQFPWQKLVDAESQQVGAKTVKNAYTFLRSVFAENGVQLPAVKLPQIVKAARPYLTWEQIPRFLEIVKGRPCEMAALLGLHSLRRSEMLALRKEDVQNGVIHVHGAAVVGEGMQLVRKETNKNTTSRRNIPIMIPRLKELVEASDGLLIKAYPTTAYSQINRLCAANGLPGVGIHGLRHSFASLAHHVGLSELETMEIGGWADRNTMHGIYQHLDAADRLAAANRMSDFYKNANASDNGGGNPL